MKVNDVMTKFPTCCTPDSSLAVAARMMRDHDCGAIPVVGDLAMKYPVGVITDRDIVIRAVASGANLLDVSVRDCMTTPAVTITEDADLGDCIDLLEKRQIRRVVVVDRDGRACGIVAQADIANHASKRKAGELLREVSKPLDGLGTFSQTW